MLLLQPMRLPGLANTPAEQRYLTEQRTRLQRNADAQPCDVALPQTLERWAERHDVGQDIARERCENQRTEHQGYRAPVAAPAGPTAWPALAAYLISIRLVTSVTPGRLATSSRAATLSDWPLT